MVFSSITFLFYFLPIVLAGYFVLRTPVARNRWLLGASFLFYLWGSGALIAILLASIGLNFWFGLEVEKNHQQAKHRRAKFWVVASIIVNIGLLSYFKYSNFLIGEVNRFAVMAGLQAPIAWDSVILPIGISFFTFQSMSYVFDVARGSVKAQRNLERFALYIALFPGLIAGPIIRYHELANQLGKRDIRIATFYEGALRFTHGLVKKVVVADAVGEIADSIFGLPPGELSTGMAWLGAFAYMMQIYFDFSGYSDMAIGLGKMFGFTFPENFRRPYSALSITDFWRRWHMTLSTWIREYLYIPLGGSRVTAQRMYMNLLLVFFLTGLWHGANWTFILWGLYHGALLVIERVSNQRHMTSEHVRHPYLRRLLVLFLVMFGWVLFRAPDLTTAFSFYGAMFWPTTVSYWPVQVVHSLSTYNLLALAASSLILFAPAHYQGGEFLLKSQSRRAASCRLLLIGVALPWAIMRIASGTFSPFLYFQF